MPCKSAKISFRGRDYKAFYTEKIPIPEGPWKFYGLPGLILHVKSEDESFEWEAINIAHNQSDNICSYKGYEKFKEKEKFLNWPEYETTYIKTIDKLIRHKKSSYPTASSGMSFYQQSDIEIVYPALEEGIFY